MKGLLPMCALMLIALGSPGLAQDAERIVLRNQRLTMTLSKTNGAIASLIHNAAGREFIAEQELPRLFVLVLTKRGDTDGERTYVVSEQAKSTTVDVATAAGKTTATLRFTDVSGRGVDVTCTAQVSDDDPLVRWRLSAELPEDVVLEEVVFPCFVLRAPLGEEGEQDAVVMGHTKGGIYQRPAEWKENTRIYARQPGSLAAQFACYYDDAVGLYTATYDSDGYPKLFEARRTDEGLATDWDHHCFATERFSLDYDVIMTTFASPDPDRPTDWRDAADIYKQWAQKQHWCARTYAQREDIPQWLKSGPAMVRFGRSWLANTQMIEKWLSDYWREFFPEQPPLITAYWGWEKVGGWVTPDYFPLFPSDEEFIRLVEMNRKLGCHAFPWPSGYHYTLTYREQEDETFEWDDRERFAQVAAPHAVHTRAGDPWRAKRSWLRGGETACMCPGDPWTIDWMNEIAIQLVKRGVDMVQVDQVVGGAFPWCYSTDHAHPPGPGLWMNRVFRKQLQTMLAECRKLDPEAVVCFEEPNEHFIQDAAIQDYRDWEVLSRSPHATLASVFNYIYHEYLPTFQSNPRPGNKFMHAHCLVTGQIPHFAPSMQIGPGPALLNGGFEDWRGEAPAGWSKVGGYQGVVWRGACHRDDAERHGGKLSLRLENQTDSDIVQVSQNVSIGGGLVVGKTYRLSAWMKAAGLAKPNRIMLGTFTSDWKHTGGDGSIAMPRDEDGWRRGEAVFTVPEGSSLLRIMLHVEGPGTVWIDDVALEEVLPDGEVREAMRPETPSDHGIVRRWVELFHGEGRPYLLFGRMLHPPRLETGTMTYEGREFPAIRHNAFRAPDGSDAVVMVNVTDQPREGRLTWRGEVRTLDLEPWEVRLLR